MSAFFLDGEGEEKTRQRRKGLFNVGDDESLDVGVRLRLLDDGIEIAHHEHHFDAGVFCLMSDFRRRIQRIRCNNDAPGFEYGEIRHHKLRRVGHEDAHSIPFFDSQIRQRARQRIGDFVHLFVGDDRAFEDGAGSIGVFSGGFFQKMEKGNCRVLNMLWYAFIIMG